MASRPRSGTGYIGLEQWLGQNQAQAAGMANSLAGRIDAQGGRTEGLVRHAVEDFEQGVDGAALNHSNDGLYGKYGERLSGAMQLATDREKMAEKYLEAGWKGPGTLDEIDTYKNARALANTAQNDANMASDFYGRQALLQKQAGQGGGYSLGQQRLDSALVGAAGGDRLNSTRAQWGGLLGRLDSAASRAKGYSENAQASSKAAAESYKADAVKLRKEIKDVHTGSKAENRKIYEETEGIEAQARIDERKAERAAIDDGLIPEDRKGGYRVDQWAAKKRPTAGKESGRKTGWPTPQDKNYSIA